LYGLASIIRNVVAVLIAIPRRFLTDVFPTV